MISQLINGKTTRFFLLVSIFFLFSFTIVFGQEHLEGKPQTYLDPESIDLTKPTIFAIPYSHLDDQWRWSYPQVAREFIKNTLDDNFDYFEEYPNFNFNWTGAFRYAMMKEYYPKKYKNLKNGLPVDVGIPLVPHGQKMWFWHRLQNLLFVRFLWGLNFLKMNLVQKVVNICYLIVSGFHIHYHRY